MEATKDFKELSDLDLIDQIHWNTGIGREMLDSVESALQSDDCECPGIGYSLLVEAEAKMRTARELIDELWRRYKESKGK